MLKLLFIFVALILIGVTLVVFIFMKFHKDEYRIQKNLNILTSLVEKSENEAVVLSLAKVQKMGTFFMEDCQIEVGSPVPNIVGKEELISTASQLRQLVSSIGVKLSDVSIVLKNKTHAQSTFVVAVTVSSSLMERDEIYPRQLDLIWEKVNGTWKIKRVKTVNVLH